MSQNEILVTGASGLVGSALAEILPHTPLRRSPGNGDPWWEPLEGRVHESASSLRAVVHLAGENVAGGRWTEARKSAIESSRVIGTRTLVNWLRARPTKPEVLVSASAIGIYGNEAGDRECHEDSELGTNFLARVCRSWETEADRASEVGIRVVKLRLGLVLQPGDGLLGTMEPIFRVGAGGPIGSGAQWLPWVHVEDVVRAIRWAVESEGASGVYNLVAPEPVRQRDFASALGRVLHRPSVLPTPAFALRLLFGQAADEALLASTRALPTRLEEADFEFRHPKLSEALDDLYATR